MAKILIAIVVLVVLAGGGFWYFWGGSTNTGLREALSQQGSREREQEAAGGLQAGFAAKNASIRGDTLPFLAMQQDKNMGLINAVNGRSLNLYGMYGKSITTPGVFSQFLMQMMQNANNAARAGASGGGG